MRVITVANQKGGVGKTTTTVNLAASLALSGARVLVVDLEPQAQAGTALGVDITMGDKARSLGWALQAYAQGIRIDLSELVYDRTALLRGWARRDDAVLHLLAAEEATMSRAQDLLVDAGVSATPMLRRMLKAVAGCYDFVLIDTPPAISSLAAVGWAAGDWVLTVCFPEYATVRGAVMLARSVALVPNNTDGECNPRYLGAVLNKTSPPSSWKRQEIDVREGMITSGLLPFVRDIRQDDRISRSIGAGVPAALSFANLPPGRQYAELVAEILDRMARPRELWDVARNPIEEEILV